MLVPAAPAGARTPLTPTAVHRFAEDAHVVRALLRIEDSLTYDAVGLRPARAKLARRIRAQNRAIEVLCTAIIHEDGVIADAERKLKLAHAGRAATNVDELFSRVEEATKQATEKLRQLKTAGDQISIVDMFEMQMLMNHLSQLSEMSTSVVSASNSAISSMARNIKS